MKNERIRFLSFFAASVVLTIVFVLIFAFLIKTFSVPTGLIRPINQVFKIIAIALGVLLGVKGEKRLLKGLLFGFCYAIVCNVLFSIASCTSFFTLSLLWDVLFSVAIGLIAGMGATALK